MKVRLIIMTFLLTFIGSANAQTITGTVKFKYDRTNYTWTYAKMDQIKAECDSVGNFELKNINPLDTLVIIPIPISYVIKIYNFPANFSSIHFNSIPLFKAEDRGYPLINFRTKRAARKYSRKLEKERRLEREEFLKTVSNYKFFWNNKEYALEVKESGESFTILIDLDQ